MEYVEADSLLSLGISFNPDICFLPDGSPRLGVAGKELAVAFTLVPGQDFSGFVRNRFRWVVPAGCYCDSFLQNQSVTRLDLQHDLCCGVACSGYALPREIGRA